MIDWRDYKYTMVVVYASGEIGEHSSNNLLFLATLGEESLANGTYIEATIHSNQEVINAETLH